MLFCWSSVLSAFLCRPAEPDQRARDLLAKSGNAAGKGVLDYLSETTMLSSPLFHITDDGIGVKKTRSMWTGPVADERRRELLPTEYSTGGSSSVLVCRQNDQISTFTLKSTVLVWCLEGW